MPPQKLLDRYRDVARLRHVSYRTEQSYVRWVKQFVRFHGTRHPAEMGTAEVQAFLTHLAVARRVSASTQNQALAALLFLYRHVLGLPLGDVDAMRARRSRYLPVVLTRSEVEAVLERMTGPSRLVAALQYGAGLRLMEALRLRVKDLDFEQRTLIVRQGKGGKDRITPLPDRIEGALRLHLEAARALHHDDLQDGFGTASLPFAFSAKNPGASRSWSWQ
jgi:integrase